MTMLVEDVTAGSKNSVVNPDSKDDTRRRRSALRRSVAHFARPKGSNLLTRTIPFFDWQEDRRQVGCWPYTRCLLTGPSVTIETSNERGKLARGINFASQDYLSLSSYPTVRQAGIAAIERFGPHSAGSPCLIGNTEITLALEQMLAEFLQMQHVLLFPTGWGAGYGTIVGLVRQDDYVVMDNLSHACLQQGAHAATSKVSTYPHLDLIELRGQLEQIRSVDKQNGILVVTEGLFSMDSDTPDILATQALCNEFDATLLVDVAHDLGSMGPGGTGSLGMQGALGRVDLVMGSFSKTFASNGGFVACNSPAVRQYIKWNGSTHSFSNGFSPVQAAVVKESLRIVRSQEGDRLRKKLLDNIESLRSCFVAHGIKCLGSPSAIVPVPVGSEAVARIASGLIEDRGLLANLVEFPAVAVGAARFRLQVMAGHERAHTCEAARVLSNAIADARAAVGSV